LKKANKKKIIFFSGKKTKKPKKKKKLLAYKSIYGTIITCLCRPCIPRKNALFWSCKPFFVSSSARLGSPIPKTTHLNSAVTSPLLFSSLVFCSRPKSSLGLPLANGQTKSACPQGCLPASLSTSPPADTSGKQSKQELF
jgi:hypothetical protein